MTVKFLFVKHLGLFPFPPRIEMTFLQFFIKGIYIIFYNVIVLLGIIGFIQLAGCKNRFPFLLGTIVIPYILLITVHYFCREHRYFTMLYPLFVVFAGYTLYSAKPFLIRLFAGLSLKRGKSNMSLTRSYFNKRHV